MCASVRNSGFDSGANGAEIVGEVSGVEIGLNGHHTAADIDTHSSRNDRTLGGNHTAYGRTDAPMDIRHGGHPFIDARELGNVEQLLAGLIFERDALGPGFDRGGVFGRDEVVGVVGHADRIAET